MKTVTVDAQALRQVLEALAGPDHLIRELQYTLGAHELTGDNPIGILMDQYIKAVRKGDQNGN